MKLLRDIAADRPGIRAHGAEVEPMRVKMRV